MIFHRSDQVRSVDKRNASRFQLMKRHTDVRRSKIQDRTCRREWLRVRFFDKETHTGTIEEDEFTKTEQLSKPQRFSVEAFRRIDVVDSKRDLTKLTQCQSHRFIPC